MLNSDMLVVKEHMLTHSILPKNEYRRIQPPSKEKQ